MDKQDSGTRQEPWRSLTYPSNWMYLVIVTISKLSKVFRSGRLLEVNKMMKIYDQLFYINFINLHILKLSYGSNCGNTNCFVGS